MPKYPKCIVMLIKYVQDKITPLLQVTPNNYEQDTWDEQVDYFRGVRKELWGKEVNLVHYFVSETSFFYFINLISGLNVG